MDAIDHQILAELTTDARIPLVTLANRVDLSRNAVKQRVERMERDEVIAGYTVVHGKKRESQVSAMVLVYRADRMRGGDVFASLARIPEVVRCDVLSGEFDLIVTVHASSMIRVGEIWEEIANLPGVDNTVTTVTLHRVIDKL